MALDGKTSRRSHARARGREPPHLVSAWASRQRLVLGRRATDAESNEITAIPPLLALTGALVTIDAIGCQTKIAEAILRRGADDLLAAKANWPALHGEVGRYFADVPAVDLDRFEATDGDHGRIEVRCHTVRRDDVAWLSADRRFPGEPRFPGSAAIAMVEAAGSSAAIWRGHARAALPLILGAARRAPVRPCRALSLAHREPPALGARRGLPRRDLCRLRTGQGPHNMAVARPMAVDLMRTASGRQSLKVRRKRAAWNVNYIHTLLRQTA